MSRGTPARALAACLVLACRATPDGVGGPALQLVVLPPEVPVDSLGPTYPSLDGPCRTVAFAAAGQVYLHRLGSREYELVSVAANGSPGHRPSGLPQQSADAARVAFDSVARLLDRPTNRHDQIYLRDRALGVTSLVSASPQGEPANDANLGFDTGLAISADGSAVAFASRATNLVPGDRNASLDVFVRDVAAGATERASVTSSGAEAHGDSAYPALSADGRFVAFSSDAADLVPGDTNGVRDVFLHDRHARTTTRLSVGAADAEADGPSDLPAISADGRIVAFASDATNLVPGDGNGVRDVFVLERASGELRRVSSLAGREADGASDYPRLDADGHRVAFATRASRLVPAGSEHQQVVVRDLDADRIWIASASADGRPGNEDSGDWGLSLSGDGRCAAFTSVAASLGARGAPMLFVTRFPD